MKKITGRNRIGNVMFKTVIKGIMGMAVLCGGLLVYRIYEYYTVVKPLKEQRVKIMREEEMLAILKSKEDLRELKLLQQQKAAESM